MLPPRGFRLAGIASNVDDHVILPARAGTGTGRIRRIGCGDVMRATRAGATGFGANWSAAVPGYPSTQAITARPSRFSRTRCTPGVSSLLVLAVTAPTRSPWSSGYRARMASSRTARSARTPGNWRGPARTTRMNPLPTCTSDVATSRATRWRHDRSPSPSDVTAPASSATCPGRRGRRRAPTGPAREPSLSHEQRVTRTGSANPLPPPSATDGVEPGGYSVRSSRSTRACPILARARAILMASVKARASYAP